LNKVHLFWDNKLAKNAGLFQTTFQWQKIQENLANILVAREAKLLLLFFFCWPRRQEGLALELTWPRKPDFCGQGCQENLAVARLARPHFPGKLGQKPGKPSLARFLTGLLMQGNGTTVKIKSKINSVEFAVYEACNICKKAVLQIGDDNFCPECSKPRRRSANILVSYYLQTLGTLVSALKW